MKDVKPGGTKCLSSGTKRAGTTEPALRRCLKPARSAGPHQAEVRLEAGPGYFHGLRSFRAAVPAIRPCSAATSPYELF